MRNVYQKPYKGEIVIEKLSPKTPLQSPILFGLQSKDVIFSEDYIFRLSTIQANKKLLTNCLL